MRRVSCQSGKWAALAGIAVSPRNAKPGRAARKVPRPAANGRASRAHKAPAQLKFLTLGGRPESLIATTISVPHEQTVGIDVAGNPSLRFPELQARHCCMAGLITGTRRRAPGECIPRENERAVVVRLDALGLALPTGALERSFAGLIGAWPGPRTIPITSSTIPG